MRLPFVSPAPSAAGASRRAGSFTARVAALALVVLPAEGLLAQDGVPGLVGQAAYVDARQALMAAMQTLGMHIDLEANDADEPTFAHLTEEAGAIVANLRAMPLLFPEGTSPADLQGIATHAAPAVWERRGRFEELSAEALAAAEAMTSAADGHELFARFEEVEAVCTACHAEFLAYDPFAGMEDLPPPDEALFDFGGSN